MPLPPAADRKPLHNRRYEFCGYQRADGLWDIEGRIVDTKTYPFENKERGTVEPGQALHDMTIRLTIDDDFLVHDIVAVTDSTPFTFCGGVVPNYRKVVGRRIVSGWRNLLRDLLGGTEGCTHMTEMLGAMGTVAYQTLYPVRLKRQQAADPAKRPALLDSCHSWAADSPVVRDHYPLHYRQPDPAST